jgi:hypothetical protein
VGTGQDGDAVVILAKAVVESASALEVGELERRDGETGSRGEWLSQVGDLIEEGVEREELGPSSDGAGYYRLNECHLNFGEASIGEDPLEEVGRSNCIFVREGAGLYANGDDERAERLGLPLVGVGERVDGGPFHALGVEHLVDLCTDREPTGPNCVTVNGTRLSNYAPSFRALAYGPFRARFEDARSTAAVEVDISVGIPLGKAIRMGEDVREGELVKRGEGRPFLLVGD